MKILKLTYNEIIKQTKKLSFKICLVILLFFALALPILYKAFAFDEDSFPLYYKEDINIYQSELIKSPRNDEEKLKNDLNNIKIDVAKKAIDKKEKRTPFKSSIYEEYLNSKSIEKILTYLLENKNINLDFIDSEYNIDTSILQNADINNLPELRSAYKEKIETLEKIIESEDYSWYIRAEVEYLSKAKELSPSDENTLKLYKKLLELDITNENDFRTKEADKIIEYFNQKEKVLSEREYLQTGNKISYDKYKKLINLKNEELDKKIKISWYAIDNNINYDKSHAKTSLNDTIQDNMVFISIIAVIIAGGIVSSEFQKGTIRLLVVRPNKRWKILLSKFLALLALILGLTIITCGASFIIHGILYGFDNYFISDLAVVANKVVKRSYLLNSISQALLLLIPIIFVGLIAFSLSTITNNTALSVGFSIFILMGYQLGVLFLTTIGFPFTAYTFLPYLDFNPFIDKLSLVDSCLMLKIYYTFTQAIIVLISWSVLLYLISNLVFKRKDIRN